MHGSFFILDDESAIRESIARKMARRKFKVSKAQNVMQARDAIEESEEPFDVALLDVQLNDPNSPFTTGLDLGGEIKGKWPEDPPVFMALSSFKEIGFYEKALNLGVEVYTPKPQRDEVMIANIRALALKRRISPHRLNKNEAIQRLFETATDRTELVFGFMESLRSTFLHFLPGPYVVLVSCNGQTQSYFSHSNFHAMGKLNVHALSALVFGRCESKPYHQLDRFDISEERLGWGDPRVRNRFKGGVFLPLMETPEVHVTLGLLTPEDDEPIKDSAIEAANALARFFRYPFHDSVTHLFSQWMASQERKKTTIETTSRLCLYIGHEQLNLVNAREDGNGLETSHQFRQLAQGLYDSGLLLDQISEDLPESEDPQKRTFADIKSELEKAWSPIKETYNVPAGMLHISGTFQVKTHVESLHLVLIRILQWLTQRSIVHGAEDQQILTAHCGESHGRLEVVFEDRSSRIGPNARKLLFEPFTQPPLRALGEEKFNPGLHFPLFLVSVLAENRLDGSFMDRTNELETSIGHRFVLRFPYQQTLAI